jgi:hypothetical protein
MAGINDEGRGPLEKKRQQILDVQKEYSPNKFVQL